MSSIDFSLDLNTFLVSSIAVGGSQFGKPNKTVFMTEVNCDGTERTLPSCDAVKLPPEDGKGLHNVIDAAGVQCMSQSSTSQLGSSAPAGLTAGAVILGVLVVISLAVIIA